MIFGTLPLPTLMILVETTLPGGGSIKEVVSAALRGGVNAVQLRDHATLPIDLEHAALELRDVTKGRATLLINDNFELAAKLHVDGVNLPEAAFDIDRSLVTYPLLLGRSVHSVETALSAQDGGADYLIAGNVYETHSHPGKDGEGTNFLKAICKAVTLPVLAIGGITPDNTADCILAGASGVVVRSGIVLSDDPEAAASYYTSALQTAWKSRLEAVR